eukprot:XP_014036549.1 PREDICTED: sialic acid-binding Ig-like lectin 6 [Salmo salar]
MACSTDNMFLIGLFMSGVLACFGQRHLITTMPEKLDVLSGSCVQIPCAFDVPQDRYTFNSAILTSGVWIKESPYFGGRPNIVIFNSSKTDNTYQAKITGNMSWKDCTTVFFNVTTSYTNIYFFRIESRPFKATDPDKSVHIVVTDLPLRPKITVSGEMKEERPVSLNCSAAAPCPKHSPKLTWTLPTLFTPENQLQENSDQTKSVLSTVTFTPSHLHHEKNITCTAVYPVGTSNKTAEHIMTLNVLFSPKNTSASLSTADPVSVGSCVNLTCSSTANPPVTNFPWFQISGGKPTWVASGQTYTLNVTVGDGGMYYCEARNDHGIEKSMKVLLAIEGKEEPLNPRVWGIAGAGATLGVILLIILITYFGWKRKSRLPDGLERTDNPLRQNSPVGMVYTNQAMTGEEPEEPAEDQPEEIYYGEEPEEPAEDQPEEIYYGEEPEEPAEDQPEEIHYGEIDFSKLRPKETPAAALDREQGQESEYAEVSVTGRGARNLQL